MTIAGRGLFTAALAIGACSHDAPLRAGAQTPDGPLSGGSVVRLTYNPGADLAPSWLPDGSGFLYTVERLDRADRDRCLALFPATGGSIAREICNRVPAADDSVDAFSAAAVGPNGRLAYVRASASLAVGWPLVPRYHELVVATLDDPQRATVLRTLPYIGPSGRGHDEAIQVRWLSDSALVYVAQSVAYIPPCFRCPPDTVPSGLELVRLDFGGPVPVLKMLPGSDQASSVALSGTDTIYFTVNGDARVYRLVLSTEALAVVHTFGTSIARDVQVAGNRLVAVVGGDVSFVVDSVAGPIQRDGGGTLMLVDLATGSETPLTPAGAFFRSPALAPSGLRLVAEAVTGRTTDLWLVEVP